MDKKNGILTTLFSWLAYKEKPDQSFFIPEVDSKYSKDESNSNTEKKEDRRKSTKRVRKSPTNGIKSGTGAAETDNKDISPECKDDSTDNHNAGIEQNSPKKRKRTIVNSVPVTPVQATPVENKFKARPVKGNEVPDIEDIESGSNTAAGNDKGETDDSKGNGKGMDDSKGNAEDSSKSSKKDKNNENGTRVFEKIEDNLSFLKKAFNHPENKDIILRKLSIADGVNAFIFYIDGMADRNTINLSVLRPLLDKSRFKDMDGKSLYDYIYDSVIETHQLKNADSQENVISDVLTGNTGVYIDGFSSYILCETKGYEKRSVDKPQVEGVVKGPQEAFNENLRTNITLIRRILKNNDLTTDFHELGVRNNAKLAIIYLKNLVNPAIVNEVTRRIKSIDTDLILGDGYLEQFIEDSPLSIIPTILSTERPDRVVSQLVEGKVAIIGDGTPFALIVPVTVADFVHTPEDTTLRWQYGTLLRFIRLFAIFVATLLPGLYVALTTFHREMIPTDLLIAIAKARENVPFPTIVEALLMELSFELIREAGIRIPGIIGNTLGIIGALILGQAAVQANLVSPVMIIIVAFTGLGNFAIPDFSIAFCARIMRIFYIAAGAFLGFYGISLTILISLAYLVSLKSFGVPIFSTIAPKTRRSFDFLIRWPLWKQELRPDYLNPLDVTRQPKISMKWTLGKAGQGKNSEGSGKSGRKDQNNE